MSLDIHQATLSDLPAVRSILREAATWLRSQGIPLWGDDELLAELIQADIERRLYFLAEVDGDPAATLRFELTDPVTWPEVPEGESAFVHRFAVRRRYAGGGVSTMMLRWALDRARSLGLEYLRLDCEADRPKLRAIYERFGFRHHSDAYAGEFFVSRYEIRILSELPSHPLAQG